MTIGRNEPCLCGSGKKYKKCCGKIEGAPIHFLVLEELEHLQRELIEYALKQHSYKMKQHFQVMMHDYEILRKDPRAYLVAFEVWYITSFRDRNHQTILEQFVEMRKDSVPRERTRRIFAEWPNVTFVGGIIEKCEKTSFRLRDVLTNELYTIAVREHNQEEDVLMFGALLPFEKEHTLFMIDFHYDSQLTALAKSWLKDQFEQSEFKDPQPFYQHSFLQLLNDIFYLYNEQDQTEKVEKEELDLSWESESQKETAEKLREFMKEENVEDLRIETGILLWNMYCHKKKPTIRKPEIYVAAMYSILGDYDIVSPSYPYSQLAERFKVSAQSISKRAHEMEKILEGQLKAGQEAAEVEQSKELETKPV
ncbi:uncharacterized protein YecA (UPF0149 family) [Oikeobacillus pervagus]|uniref:Uncharacterized protein YecA (UPF0149 family) n=1 Tax=Oikeobacillus pervagus TaxID=1325931 RepID=A0AAJ1SY39_9BACI|nr:SEC-C metal-binding domain-containing protein [Oikeobacillus pervagus]MDQ0214900.1 uncharacterized protein YecA (UPF0149 family) [Oikeobacillus pervagus]